MASPWKGPYTGPTREDVPRETLRGTALAGYQGWFTAPGDGTDLKYFHWSNDNARLTTETIHSKMWPDLREFSRDDLTTAGELKMRDGSAALLYSAMNGNITARHFQWMREYGIDGVWLSRFITGADDVQGLLHNNTNLANVRAGAHREGRVWAMMLDVSNGGLVPEDFKREWRFLIDEVKLREDTRYLHQDGKLVVMVWGLGFTSRHWNAEQAHEIIDFLHDDPQYGGNYVVGGVPSRWRTATKDSKPGAEWRAVYDKFDAISPWSAGRFNIDGSGGFFSLDAYAQEIWAKDLEELKREGRGRIYVPTVLPGFKLGKSFIAREKGQFYWNQWNRLKALGVDTVFVGMFDEVDEAVAIYKVTNDPPVIGGEGLLTLEGLPEDYYLKMTGMGTRLLHGEIENTETIPAEMPFPIQEAK